MTNSTQTPCPDTHNQFACKDKTQCFEPCGDLGHSENHAAVYTGPAPVITHTHEHHEHAPGHACSGGGKKSGCCGRCRNPVTEEKQ